MLNRDKASLQRSTRIRFLGAILDREQSKVFPTRERVIKIFNLANKFKKKRVCFSTSLQVIPWDYVILHSSDPTLLLSYETIPAGNGQSMGAKSKFIQRHNQVHPPEMKDILQWCTREDCVCRLDILNLTPQFLMTTDTSLEDRREHLQDVEVSGTWTP